MAGLNMTGLKLDCTTNMERVHGNHVGTRIATFFGIPVDDP